MKLIVALTGATGALHGVRLLQTLQALGGVEVHLILSPWAEVTLAQETPYTPADLGRLVHQVHDSRNLGATLASGSFRTAGMVVSPCSMRTVAAIAHGLSDNLIVRAADVCLKEGRKLVLCPRETPLSAIHLENLLALARLGVRLVPPMPAYYNHPATIDDLVDHHVMKVLDHWDLDVPEGHRWQGLPGEAPDES
jgi:4-hydroxy-3-polyprenylbenzoate decarboxylase